MLEHLVEHLGRRAAGSAARPGTAATVGSNTSCRQRDATTDSDSGRFCLPLERLAVARDVVQHPPGLVLLRVEPGQPQQAVAVMARLDDVRVEAQAVALRRRDELDLLDVEAELVQPAQALVDPEPLVGRERLLARQLGPERLVAARRSRRRSRRDRGPAGRPTSASTSSSSPMTLTCAISMS